jgi:Zinc finger, C2H2 type.
LSGLGDLKFLEHFTNPYVRVSVFCKVCSKEQSLKQQGSWKRHFLTHSSEKPLKCPHCDKGFVQSGNLKKHVQTVHKHLVKTESVKTESERFSCSIIKAEETYY